MNIQVDEWTSKSYSYFLHYIFKKLHKRLDMQKDIKTNRMKYIIVIHTRNVSYGSLYKSAPILLREAIELGVPHFYLYYIYMDT